jgi:acyl-CoA reductase-like NAD-dependent aldehyde dehydrogenase
MTDYLVQVNEYTPQFDAGRNLAAPHGRSFVVNRPYGVVASIVP